MHLPDKKKFEQLLGLIDGGMTISAASRKVGVPRPTARDWNAGRARFTKALKASIVADKQQGPSQEEILTARVKLLEGQIKASKKEDLSAHHIRTAIVGLYADVSTAPEELWTFTTRSKESAPGVPTLFLSDLHWGEVVHPSQINGVNEYDMAIAAKRLKSTIESSIHLLKIISPGMDYPGIVCVLGGDMISGNIHDELMATNEMNTMPTLLDLFGKLTSTIEYLADHFGRVFLPCVSGNHGRDTKKIWGKDRHHTSFDWLLYNFLAKRFEDDDRVCFFIPDGPDALYRIYNHKYLLTHGDSYRGGDGMIGCLGPILRGDHKKRSRNAQVDMEFDTQIMGHWHQYIHHSRVIVNGSLKGYDEYAYSNNFGFERPQQALWLTHPSYGITYRMPVYSDKHRPQHKTDWISFSGGAVAPAKV